MAIRIESWTRWRDAAVSPRIDAAVSPRNDAARGLYIISRFPCGTPEGVTGSIISIIAGNGFPVKGRRESGGPHAADPASAWAGDA
jgi:hypothetical protein